MMWRALFLGLFLTGCGGSTSLYEPFVPIRYLSDWEPVVPPPVSSPVEPVRWHIARGCCVRPD